MIFKERYISEDKAEDDPLHKKKVISDDAYALGEVLEQLTIELRRLNNK